MTGLDAMVMSDMEVWFALAGCAAVMFVWKVR